MLVVWLLLSLSLAYFAFLQIEPTYEATSLLPDRARPPGVVWTDVEA